MGLWMTRRLTAPLFACSRTMLLASLVPALAMLLFCSGPAQADKMHPEMMSHRRFGMNANNNCRRPLFNICQGCSITIRMRVPQNGTCPINYKSLGPFAGQEVLVRPSNGLYGSANETATAYRPNPGFVGQDHFETRLYFEEGNGRRTAMTVKVNVFVVPHL
jgi:hypothetical protein